VRFPDLTTARFRELTTLLDKAGERRDPERLTLEWQTLLTNPFAEVAVIKIDFVTEKPLETEELSLLQFHRAMIALEIGGPTQSWVDSAAEQLSPILQVTRIGGIYRPLLLFRNREVVQTFSWLLAVVGQVVAIEALASHFRGPRKSEAASEILGKSGIAEKFDAWIRYTLLDKHSLLEPLIVFGGAMLFFGLCLFGGFWLFPRLVPQSGIQIGLAGVRIARYRNLCNLIIITILLSGLLLPLIRKLLGF
jgi:hypothetical protein